MITSGVLKFIYNFSNKFILAKTPSIFTTLVVTKFLRSKTLHLVSENIKCISVTFEVSKEDKSNEVNELQPPNISLIEFTEAVFKFCKLTEVSELQLRNI